MASATSTPRLAYAQAPVLPPSPIGLSRYPCQVSQLALELVTRPQPMTVAMISVSTGTGRISPYLPFLLNNSDSA